MRFRGAGPSESELVGSAILGAVASGNVNEWNEGYQKMSEAELVAAHKVFGVLKDLSPRQQAETIEKAKNHFGPDFGNPKRETELKRVVLEHVRDLMIADADTLSAASFRLDAGERHSSLGVADGSRATKNVEVFAARAGRAFDAMPSEDRDRLMRTIKNGKVESLKEDPAFARLQSDIGEFEGDEEEFDRLMTERAVRIEARRLVRDWHCPPGKIGSASHMDLMAMNAAHVQGVLGLEPEANCTRARRIDLAVAIGKITAENQKFNDIMARVGPFLALGAQGEAVDSPYLKGDEVRIHNPNPVLQRFLTAWRGAAYARLEVGHKLAASLCLTDVPDDVAVKAPWSAWSLVVPDGLLGDFARIWCIETEPMFLVGRSGALVSMAKQAEHGLDSGPVFDMARALIRGACLALSNPDDFRKENQHAPTARAKGKGNRSGPPDLQQARFMLSAPVKVDLREHVAAALSGKSHASPTVQFLVRGHWRNQTHGPRNSLRRVQWIQPFWKGPEESRILLRQHRVEEPTP